MTSRERWLAVLERRTPDRVPMDYWGTTEATQKVMQYLGVATVEEMEIRLHIDRPLLLQPAYTGPALPSERDIYGVEYRRIAHEGGVYREITRNPLAQFDSVEAIEANYVWPSADWYDYSVLPRQLSGQEHRPIRGGGCELFMVYKALRGEERACMDLLLNPEIVHYCMNSLLEFHLEFTQRIYETVPGKVMITYVAEDLGSQEGLMYSAAHIREFVLPYMKRMMNLAHEAGAFVFHHDDGNCRPILPDMIESGIDVLNPVQWRCKGMERGGLKRDFGDRVVFHGGVDNQYTLPFGTAEEVRQEVIDNLRILGTGGGYILAPCHNIQVIGPAENVATLYETGYECGWTGER